jgi:hypothetical protein
LHMSCYSWRSCWHTLSILLMLSLIIFSRTKAHFEEARLGISSSLGW